MPLPDLLRPLVAQPDRACLLCDFDGTVSAIVADPADAVALPGALDALARLAARLGSGSSNAGQGFELGVIAAVVLGRTSLFGGRGTMVGTVLGALTVAVIGNGLILSHLSPFLTPIVTGCIILIAIWMNFRIFRGQGRKR